MDKYSEKQTLKYVAQKLRANFMDSWWLEAKSNLSQLFKKKELISKLLGWFMTPMDKNTIGPRPRKEKQS